MKEQLTTKEYLALQYLANGKDHDKTPDSLTDAQYYSALKSLKDKDMVYAAFVEGGEVFAAQIKTKGQAILDDLADEANHIIRGLIEKDNLTDEQFSLLKVARNDNGAKNIFGVSNDVYKKQIWAPLIGRGYLKLDRTINTIVITPLGNSLLTQIDKQLAYEITSKDKTCNVCPNNTNASTGQTNYVENRPCIYINEKYRELIIKDIITANNYGYFKDKDGNPINDIQQIIAAFAQFFNDEKMKEYASSAENITNENEELTKELCPLFYNDIVATNSFIEKIKSTNNNTEKTKIAAEFVKERQLSDCSCRKTLWKILNNHKLYLPSSNNWTKYINIYLFRK